MRYQKQLITQYKIVATSVKHSERNSEQQRTAYFTKEPMIRKILFYQIVPRIYCFPR